MRRRTFVWSGVGAIAALAAWDYVTATDEDTIAMVVRTRLHYLKLEPQGVLRFAHDLAGLQVISKARMHVLSEIEPLYVRYPLSSAHNALAYKLRHGEERIVASYLISTDFFINGANEALLVSYLGLLDPRRACGNPFARPPA